MEQITIRKAAKCDLETLYAFEQGVITAERPFDCTLKDDPIHYYDIAHMISAPHIELAVAVAGDQIVGSGYARLEESKIYLKHQQHAYLGFMYVLPDFRGRGINKMIIEYLKQWGVSQNVGEFRLEVYNSNDPAINAYEKVGFQKLMIEMRLGLYDKQI
jgi:ribosomal protein S18 acetylase RimI-like enzyme